MCPREDVCCLVIEEVLSLLQFVFSVLGKWQMKTER